QDSLGRASTGGTAVRIGSPAAAPFFPVGPAAVVTPARDTVLAQGDTVLTVVGQSDSLRVRVVDAQGRGVGGIPVSWATTSGALGPVSGVSDVGGRFGGSWHPG